MLLRYDGTDAKFTAYGITWTPGDIQDVDLPQGEILWLTRHGFTQLFPAAQAKAEEVPEQEPQQETFVSMHGAFIEQPARLAESLGRTLGRKGRK